MDNDWVIIGRFGRPHGIKGFITVNSFTEPRDNILHYPQWYAKLPQGWQALSLIAMQNNHRAIVVQVEGFPEREQVAQLTNVDIGVPNDCLPTLSEGEYYWRQLIGLTVKDLNGFELGQVSEILPTGSNDVLVVKGKKRVLIPYLHDIYVMQVDLAHGQIIVDWDQDS